MNCKDFEQYSSLYIDEMLTDKEKIEFEKHIEDCSLCSTALENLKTIVGCLNDIDEIELPSNFSTTLRQKLSTIEAPKEEASKRLLKWSNGHWKGLAAGLVILVVSVTAYNNIDWPTQYKMQEEIAYEDVAEAAPRDADFGVTATDGGIADAPTITSLQGLNKAPSLTATFSDELKANAEEESTFTFNNG